LRVEIGQAIYSDPAYRNRGSVPAFFSFLVKNLDDKNISGYILAMIPKSRVAAWLEEKGVKA